MLVFRTRYIPRAFPIYNFPAPNIPIIRLVLEIKNLGEVKEGLALDIETFDETVTAFYGTDFALNRKLKTAREGNFKLVYLETLCFGGADDFRRILLFLAVEINPVVQAKSFPSNNVTTFLQK